MALQEPARQGAVQRIGEDLLVHMGRERPALFRPAEWKGKIIGRAMENEPFRVALFRFVDVLPTVHSDARLMELAREYFEELGPEASEALGWSMKALSRRGLFRKVAIKVLRSQVEDLARQFIAGETVAEALKPLEKLWREGCANSVDLLGEVAVSREESGTYRERYLQLLSVLDDATRHWGDAPRLTRGDHGPLPAVNISIKLSALDPLLAPVAWDDSVTRAKDVLRPIFARARELGAHVHVDMEHHDLKELTLTAFRELLEEPEFTSGPSCGIALQAYLKSAEDDLGSLLAWCREKERPVSVRLVKGAYWDQEVISHRQQGHPVPVWEDKARTDATYESMTRTLLQHRRWLRPAFAGHNPRSVAHAIACARELGVPDDGYEFQVIYGMAEPLRRALEAMGFRVRAYCPVGAFLPGMAYLVRRLLENTANTSMLRRMYGGEEGVERLLAPPGPSAEEPRPEAEEGPGFRNEPLADFTERDVRGGFARALAKVREGLGGEYPARIGGEPVRSGTWLESRDPADPGRVVGMVSECSSAQAEQAVSGAVVAAPGWAATPPRQRADLLRRAADLLRRDRFELAALEVFEVGKGWAEADADVAEAIDFLGYYARQMERLAQPVRLGHGYPGEMNHLGWRPRGVGAVISPWNFPLAIPTGMVSAALVTGNGVVFKPSERAPVCGARLYDVFREAGLPPGVLQFVPGHGDPVGRTLVNDPRIDFVAFTGSREVGLEICRAAAEVWPGQRGVKRVIAEMGGKNAILVDETADLDEAVLGIVHSALGYQGQKCSACSRVIAHRAVHDILVERLCAAIRTLPVGPPEDPRFRLGPVVDERAREKVLHYIAIGREEGREALAVEDVPEAGRFVGPAVFTEMRPDHRLAREEVFGPVLAVMRADSLEEAIDIANDGDYALTGGLFSRSPAAIRRVRERLEVGNLYINRGITGALVGRQPFGGFRFSGIGSKTGGPDYLTQFLLPVSVSENTLRRGFAPGEG